MGKQRVKYSSEAAPEVLAAMREIGRSEGRQFQAVMEEAMEEFVANRKRERPRPEVMANFRASVERNRRLMELLAECVGSDRRTAKRSLCTAGLAEGEREAAARIRIAITNGVRTFSTRPAGKPGQGAKTMKTTYYPRPALLGWLALLLALLLSGACVPQEMVVSPLGTVVGGRARIFRSGRWRC